MYPFSPIYTIVAQHAAMIAPARLPENRNTDQMMMSLMSSTFKKMFRCVILLIWKDILIKLLPEELSSGN